MNPIEIIRSDITKQSPPACSRVFLPYFFIIGIVKAAAIAGSKLVRIGIILLRSGRTYFTILPPYRATELTPVSCW